MEDIQGSSSGKTSLGHLVAITETTLEPCLRKSDGPKFQCLSLVDGQHVEWQEFHSVTSHGEFLTLNIGESPSVAVESTLSQILEVNVQEKYYLSQRACQGILRRAAARGKELPMVLKKALERQAVAHSI